MGKAARWLKGLLGKKKEKDCSGYSGSLDLDKREKKRTEKDEVRHITQTSVTTFDRTRLRSYVAKKENVRSKSCDRATLLIASREGWAAVLIQSFFRGYLARKALRALKGLVKIQALVRGYLVRKRVAATLHSMQAMIRSQAVARSVRARCSIDKENRHHPQTSSRKYVQQRFDEARNYRLHNRRVPFNGFEESQKVVEVDTHKPHLKGRSRSINSAMSECGEDSLHYHQAMSSSLRCRPVQGRISLHERQHQQPQEFEWLFNVDEGNNKFSTAHNTPRLPKCMLPDTPVKSVCGETETFFRTCSNFPNYMSNTHSSKAKLRSHSAPKLRPELKKRLSINEMMAARNSVSGVTMQWSSSNPNTQDYCFFERVI